MQCNVVFVCNGMVWYGMIFNIYQNILHLVVTFKVLVIFHADKSLRMFQHTPGTYQNDPLFQRFMVRNSWIIWGYVGIPLGMLLSGMLGFS